MNKISYNDLPTIDIKPYIVKQLSSIYGVGKKTISKWIASVESEVGQRIGYRYNCTQIAIIFNKFGIPKAVLIISHRPPLFMAQ